MKMKEFIDVLIREQKGVAISFRKNAEEYRDEGKIDLYEGMAKNCEQRAETLALLLLAMPEGLANMDVKE